MITPHIVELIQTTQDRVDTIAYDQFFANNRNILSDNISCYVPTVSSVMKLAEALNARIIGSPRRTMVFNDTCIIIVDDVRYAESPASQEADVAIDNAHSGLHLTDVAIVSAAERFAEVRQIVTSYITEGSLIYAEWMYGEKGETTNIPIQSTTLHDEAYPWLTAGADATIDEYIASNASIIILQGPPGTGKTNFIRRIITKMGRSALVTYDPNIIRSDGYFARFMSSSAGSVVMEDADTFLQSRSSGNEMMHRFLNVGDGLVSTGYKKIIFSTNLANVRDIDSALIRPGRCFGVLQFRELSEAEAFALADKLKVTLQPKTAGSKYSLAEVYNSKPRFTVTNRFGFLS